MCNLLSSIKKLDYDLSKQEDPDFNFDAHIFFDDAFCGEGRNRKLNKYTNDLYTAIVETMKDEGAEDSTKLLMKEAKRQETPYGSKYQFKLKSHDATLTVHFKDKDKIRNKKRWSQVMYFNYILSYKVEKEENTKETFILALDGDVEFEPEAVKHLLKGIQRSDNVGACCGRIHPKGSGPMLWYQKFEYAASHWLQKSTEHVAGCVLCSPGCFTLVRRSAIMDGKVFESYTKNPEKAIDHIQFDQGEDRWLCTLLLKEGHRIEYCAAADALTFAPEGFGEFFMQRRRWTPSTLANIYDIISDWKVADDNNSITRLFLLYQLFLFVTALITPGTIFLLMYGALIKAYNIPSWLAFQIILIPVLIFILSVFTFSGKAQLKIAAFLSGIFGIVMMVVIIGIFKSGIESGWCADTTIFIILVAVVFVVSALLHPQEITCIFPGILYIFCVPAMSMLLLIYAIGNIHVTSWGTREATKSKGKRQGRESSCSIGTLLRCTCCPNSQINPTENNVICPPWVLRQTAEKQVLKVGDKMCLKVICTGNPNPVIQWFKDDVLLKNSPIWMIRSKPRSMFTLKKRHIQLSDAGKYTCTATNEKDTKDVTWTVIVSEAEGAEGNPSKPVFLRQLNEKKNLYEGDNLVLRTYFVGCADNQVKWYFKEPNQSETEIEQSPNCTIKTKDSESVLIKRDMKVTDAGKYLCKLKTDIDTVTESTITVKDCSSISTDDTEHFRDRTIIVGEKLTMSLRTTGSKVRWMRNGNCLIYEEKLLDRKRVKVPNEEGIFIKRKATLLVFTIEKVKITDNGRYKCQIYDSEDKVICEKTAIVIVKEKSENIYSSHISELEKHVSKTDFISSDEEKFWYKAIDKYLGPDLSDTEAIRKQNIIKQELKDLRNKLFYGFLLMNTMYVVLVYTLTEVNSNKDLIHIRIACPASSIVPFMDIQPISIVFTLTFGIIMVFQFFGMLYHRFSTFAQIIVLPETDISKSQDKSSIHDRNRRENSDNV